MAFARDKRDRMFNASNLNGLYSRFDQKVSRVLDGKSPKVAKRPYDEPAHFDFGLLVPYGVDYTYTLDGSTGGTLNYNQADAYVELSKLENAHLDAAGGQVYVDRYPLAGESFSCDISKIHYSFELLRREIDGISYDVHLGWDENGALNSYVRGSLGSEVPTLPPGRIHKHRVGVAEIVLKGPREFRVLNNYQRFDCWRVHNLSKNTATVILQLPDGSGQRETIAPYGCRSFRRKADGSWATTWPNGSDCQYFFPFFTGDVPYFAGGPPIYDWPVPQFVAHERSARANNVANPFVLLQWFRACGGWHDPFIPYDIRQTYPDVYGDPEDANTPIGDLIFTWGRARVQIYSTLSGAVSADFMKVFRDTETFVETLRSLGIEVQQIAGALGLRTVEGNTAIRIYPVDCNVFFTSNSVPYWEISPSLAYFSTIYPAEFWTQNLLSPMSPTAWTAGNEPDWFETMRTLRRRIAVEEGFLNNFDDVVDVPEEKVSKVALTPLGLMVRAATSVGITNFDANAMSEFPNYERTANKFELWTESQGIDFGSGSWIDTRYTSGVKVYYLQNPANSVSDWYQYVFPNLATISANYFPAVDCGYVPAGGPWGFSSSVYDENLQRVFTTNPIAPVTVGVHGSDFWLNKWGGPNGVDASVRIPGEPNQTLQSPVLTTNNPILVADDIFKDLNVPTMAGLAPWYGSQIIHTGVEQCYISEIRWLGSQYFSLPYIPQADAVNYTRNGAFFHKIPKSAFLWNLLEWTVRSWTRAIPLCLGEVACPITGFTSNGTPVASNFGIEFPKDLTASGIEGSEPVFYLLENQYNVCLANGIVAQTGTDAGGTPFWYVSQTALATYSSSQGFKSWNFDCLNGQPTIATPVAPTAWIPLRSYGTGEAVEMASYYDDILSQQFYRSVRYVSLRLPNELAS